MSAFAMVKTWLSAQIWGMVIVIPSFSLGCGIPNIFGYIWKPHLYNGHSNFDVMTMPHLHTFTMLIGSLSGDGDGERNLG